MWSIKFKVYILVFDKACIYRRKIRQDLTYKMGLDEELKTVLVMSGGFGMGPVESIVKALYDVRINIQIIVVAGKNLDLKNNIESMEHRIY